MAEGWLPKTCVQSDRRSRARQIGNMRPICGHRSRMKAMSIPDLPIDNRHPSRPRCGSKAYPAEITAFTGQHAACTGLMTVPGIGPIMPSAMVAAIGAWLGLVPRQISAGDSTILGKIAKQGNRYLRVLF